MFLVVRLFHYKDGTGTDHIYLPRRTKSAMVPIPEGSETYSESGPTEYSESQDGLDQPIELTG